MTNVAKNFSTGSVGRSDLFSQKDVVDAAEFGDLIFTMPETPWDSFEAAFFFPVLDVFRTCCGTTHNLQNCMNKFLNNWFSWHLELPNLCVFLRRTLRTCITKQAPTFFHNGQHPKTRSHIFRAGQKQGPSSFPHWTKPTQSPTLSAAVKIQFHVPTLFSRTGQNP